MIPINLERAPGSCTDMYTRYSLCRLGILCFFCLIYLACISRRALLSVQNKRGGHNKKKTKKKKGEREIVTSGATGALARSTVIQAYTYLK